jgi:hypothetical protein
MSEKIQPMHTEREAYVYIRQSTMQQVRTRLEGQRRQYDLRERAISLGSCRSQGHPSRAYWTTRPIAPTEQCANHHVF